MTELSGLKLLDFHNAKQGTVIQKERVSFGCPGQLKY